MANPANLTAVDTRRLIELCEQVVGDDLQFLLGKLRELADGVKVLRYDKVEKEEVVYLQPPDRQAIMYLLDRVLGKPATYMQAQVAHTLKVKLSLNERVLPGHPGYDPSADPTLSETKPGLVSTALLHGTKQPAEDDVTDAEFEEQDATAPTTGARIASISQSTPKLRRVKVGPGRVT